MTDPARIVVVSACTGSKVSLPRNTKSQAQRLYAGEQHRRLMDGVDLLRRSNSATSSIDLDLRIVSARYGLARADELLGSYDTTFSGMRKADLNAHAKHLQIPDKIAVLLASDFSLALLLLGDDYLRAAALGDGSSLGGPVLAFCGKRSALQLSPITGLRTVVLGNAEASRFACGLIGLKGEMGRRVLLRLADRPTAIADLVDPAVDVLDYLEAGEQQLTAQPAA